MILTENVDAWLRRQMAPLNARLRTCAVVSLTWACLGVSACKNTAPAGMQPLAGFLNYFTDGTSVYYCDCTDLDEKNESFVRLDGATKTSLAFICRQTESAEYLRRYVRSNGNIYYRGRKLEGANASAFEIVDFYSGYAKDNARVFWGHDPIAGADPSSFRVIRHDDAPFSRCSADGHHVYLDDHQLRNAKPNTFKVDAHPQCYQ